MKTFRLFLHPIKLGGRRTGKQLQSQVTMKNLLGNEQCGSVLWKYPEGFLSPLLAPRVRAENGVAIYSVFVFLILCLFRFAL